ncbi:peptidylprolyl isomerase [Acidimangrovimonas sediminis]|uniref:peptidylprolyl isomerase n=1 Tax=Acidimangrovimonas sediminis TaxID=2056283 RepID=UPI000C8104EC|nr:peptidylprolyl isomerase [Acidimangrovimonas sediminis]
MSDRRVFLGLAGAGALALAAMVTLGGEQPARADTAPADTPGPNLVIQVDGASGKDKGTVVIDLLPKVAPKAVAQVVKLAKEGKYDGVVFHRVIDGFMAQTGDVEYGKHGGDLARAGVGGSSLPDLPAEFSKVPYVRGTVGMARTQDPNSANSQFFIMFAPASNLNGQYTVIGRVIKGMDVVDAIKKGDQAQNGKVSDPDYMAKVTVQE